MHKHYVTVYFSHEMSMDDASTNEMMEKGVCGGGEAHGILPTIVGYGMRGGQRKNNTK